MTPQVPYFWRMHGLVQPYGRLGSQKCFLLQYGDDGCLRKGRGMVEAEFWWVGGPHDPDHDPPFPYQHVLACAALAWCRRSPGGRVCMGSGGAWCMLRKR